MKIYVASSWRNNHQPEVVTALREAEHDIYDFRNPTPDNDGFQWSEIDPAWKDWSPGEYFIALDHPVAEFGFKLDMDAMRWADVCVLVLPCGRSAHLELGWFCGQQKATCILHDRLDPVEPELMAKMADAQFASVDGVIDWLKTIRK